MKKIKLVIGMLTILCIIFTTGCGAKVSTVNENINQTDLSMFVEIENTLDWRIVYHKDTKVMYAVSKSAYNMGNFTVMVDENGDPLLYNK